MRKLFLIFIFVILSSTAYGHGPPGRRTPLSEYHKTTLPVTTDDYSKGYQKGSLWVDVSGFNLCILMDESIGNADWWCAVLTSQTNYLLQENGQPLLLEDGSKILIEGY